MREDKEKVVRDVVSSWYFYMFYFVFVKRMCFAILSEKEKETRKSFWLF